jgi:hypothetical protein
MLSGYWFFSIPKCGRFLQFFEIWTCRVSIFFFLDYLDQPGINIPEWPAHQDINVHLFLWINNCWICIRASFCNNLPRIAPSGYAYGGGFSITWLRTFKYGHLDWLLGLQILHVNKEDIGMTYTWSSSQYKSKHCIHYLHPIPPCCSLSQIFFKKTQKDNRFAK